MIRNPLLAKLVLGHMQCSCGAPTKNNVTSQLRGVSDSEKTTRPPFTGQDNEISISYYGQIHCPKCGRKVGIVYNESLREYAREASYTLSISYDVPGVQYKSAPVYLTFDEFLAFLLNQWHENLTKSFKEK